LAFVPSVRRDGRHLIGVVIGEKSNGARNMRMRLLIEKHLSQAAPTRTPPSIIPAMHAPEKSALGLGAVTP
jgi:D-alanyl-D-alanine carboxypeptidase